MKRALCLLICLLLLPLMPAQAYDKMAELGAWEAFPMDSPWRGARYTALYHNAGQGIILVVLYNDSLQWLWELRQVDGRWQQAGSQSLACCDGQPGHLYVMNSEEPDMPELVHSHSDGQGKGYMESFWFEYVGGSFLFKEAALILPLPGEPLSEYIMRLRQVDQGIALQPYHSVRDSVAGPQPLGQGELVPIQNRFSIWQGVMAYPRSGFLHQLAAQGIIFGGPAPQADEAVTALIKTDKPTDRLNLRVKPDQKADMIARYYTGTPALILEDTGGPWVKVFIGWDRQGYMMRKYLAFGDERQQVKPAMPVYTLPGPWQLRYEPFDQSHVKQSYQGGEQIEVMGLMNGWWHVRLKGSDDWGFIRELEAL